MSAAGPHRDIEAGTVTQRGDEKYSISGWLPVEPGYTTIPDDRIRRRQPMWTVAEAIALIREVHPAAFAAGWNLHLGGALATKSDTSDRDADILAMPRCQTARHDRDALADHLIAIGWNSETPWTYLPNREIRTFWKDGRVLELIFVSLA